MRTAATQPKIPRPNEPNRRRYRHTSYIFNWHTLAQHYVNALRGSDLILSFMSVAELRMGAMSAGWGSQRRLLLERFVHGFELFFPG